MNSEDNKKAELFELTEEALKKVSGGEFENGNYPILFCIECGTLWEPTISYLCSKCGRNILEDYYNTLKLLGLRRNSK